MPVRPQFNANQVPLPRNLIYMTPDGRRLCPRDADRYVQHMTRRKVNGYTFHGREICDHCGEVLTS